MIEIETPSLGDRSYLATDGEVAVVIDPYVAPAGSGVEFEHVHAAEGDVLAAGAMRLRVLHTPGHTHHHLS
jgi:glyoxylase-like metal-dependent hydrolase (beta-lactamase superfamily II)